MAIFDEAIPYVLANEGGLVIDSADPGGLTNFGISARSYPTLDIRNLTREQATGIYHRDFWMFDDLKSQRIATKVFDSYVNMGRNAICILQLSLASLQAGPIVPDGVFGSQTIEHVNAADEDALMAEYKARLALAYCNDVVDSIVSTVPNKRKFLLGWLRRAVRG